MNNSIFISEESARCMLCQNAPCTKACASGQPDSFIRSLRFDNISQSLKWIEECSSDELAAAESACIHYDCPIRINALAEAVRKSASAYPQESLPSLEIKFYGFTCENPFFLASSAVCTNYEMVAKAFDAGWAGVFYKTICFQEINEVSPRFDAVHSSKRGDFYGFRNMEQLSENPVDMDFDILSRLKKNYPSKIVIASIMGQNEEDWIQLAQMADIRQSFSMKQESQRS